MEYTTKKIEATRGRLREQEVRVAHQRKKVQQAVADRDPADELHARLLIMEQSLVAMARFLKILERDLREEMSIQGFATGKRVNGRIADRRKRARSETVGEAADRFASQATESVLATDPEVESLDTLSKAMRKLSGH
jgi:hypothetical protein